MKKILFIGFIILLMASISYAEDQCKLLGNLAETIMTKRQEGVDLTTMLNTAESQGTSEVVNISRKLVIAAYDSPEYSTQEYKEKAIRKFKTKVMVECYKK